MDRHLVPVLSTDPSAYLYQNITSRTFTPVNSEGLSRFLAESLLAGNINYSLFVDWTRCVTHPIIFDINVKSGKPTHDILLEYFRTIFLNALQKYINFPSLTVILSMRRNYEGGMHVHLPNLEISHDDYLHLCNLMQPLCTYHNHQVAIHLNVPSRMSLVSSSHYHGTQDLYVPVRVMHVEFKQFFCDNEWKSYRIQELPLRYDETSPSSLFDQIAHDLAQDQKIRIACLMMPLPKRTDPVTHLAFPCRLITHRLKRHTYIPSFTSCLNNEEYTFSKQHTLQVSEAEPFCYHFLKRHAPFLKYPSFSSNNALNLWYQRFQLPFGRMSDLLRALDIQLQKICVHLKEDPSPMCTLLGSKTYSLPTFYTLCNLMRKKECKNQDVVEQIFRMLPASTALSDLPPVPGKSWRLTFNTLLYGAFKTVSLTTKEGTFFGNIGKGWDWILEATMTDEQMKDHIRHIQKKFYPVVQGSNDRFYGWNPEIDRWESLSNPLHDIGQILKQVFDRFQLFEGYDKLPQEVLMQFTKQPNWMEPMAHEIISNWKEKCITGNYENISDEKLQKEYGANVPEYYFFQTVPQDITN